MDASAQHVKHLSTPDKRHGADHQGKSRLRFASSRQRSKQATADVYRSYKRRTGVVTSAATREERVHHHQASATSSSKSSLTSSSLLIEKNRKRSKDEDGADKDDDSSSPTKRPRLSTMRADQDAFPTGLTADMNALDDDDDENVLLTVSDTATELDLALERNGSEVFVQFHRQVWHLVRSLPEILHHSEKIIDLLLFYLLSPVKVPKNNNDAINKNNNSKQQQQQSRTNEEDDEKDEPVEVDIDAGLNLDDNMEEDSETRQDDEKPEGVEEPEQQFLPKCFQPNLATTDILHLLAVLARDLRHEIHPFLHTKILPRILNDLLNPPPPPTTSSSASQQQNSSQQQQAIPLDVVIVEAAFRAMSYIFRYDAEALLEEKTVQTTSTSSKNDNNDNNNAPCLEPMRQYYGVTLANRRELVRRLAAESFAPLIRKLSSEGAKKQHLKRVLKALAASAATSSSSTSSAVDHVTNRLQVDAIDGISKLCFEVARGASGVLHSKAGPLVVKCVLECVAHKADPDHNEGNNDSSSAAGHALVYAVGVAFVQQAMQQLKPASATVVFKETLQASRHALFPTTSSSRRDNHEKDKGEQLRHGGNRPLSVVHILQLANQQLSPAQKSGGALVLEHDGIKEYLLETLELVFAEKCFSCLTIKSRQAAMEMLCSTWTAMPRNESVGARLCQLLAKTPGLFSSSSLVQENSNNAAGTRTRTATTSSSNNSLSMILTRSLLPHLPLKIAMSKVGQVLLASAFQQVEEQRDESILSWIFALASLQEKSQGVIIMDNDDTFHPENARLCEVSASMQESLLALCLEDLESLDFSVNVAHDSIVRLHKCCTCAVFVAMLAIPSPQGKKSQNNKHHANMYKQVSKWLGGLLRRIADDVKDRQCSSGENMVAARQENKIQLFSTALDALARLSLGAVEIVGDVKIIERSLMKIRPAVEMHILSNSSSVSAVRSSATFAVALKRIDKSVCNDRDAVFHALTPNLCDDNHFLRLHTLRFLTTFPNLPFVTDHADLDLTEDLDEEPSGKAPVSSMKTSTGPTGMCDIMHVLYELESAPVAFAKERELLSLVSRVEVLGRCGKLAVVYAEAATCHLLGLFNVRFGPIWPALVQGLVALYDGHEQCVWPHISRQLAELMDKTPYRKVAAARTTAAESAIEMDGMATDAPVDFDEDKGRISRIRSTDQGQVLQSMWSIFEAAPQLAATHSRDLIPIVLKFLHVQFFHPRDPDALELRLEDHIDSVKGLHAEEQVDRRAVEARLVAILKAFSALNGPQQLFKHKLMFQIFSCLLGHQEATVGQLALSCVLRFKPRYLMPYGEVTKKLFVKGKLRDAMLQLKECAQNDALDQEHRSDLFPLLARTLMGRLSARAGSTSKKDSPSARRIAIFSFVAAMCKNDDEVYPFVYLTLRRYIPPNTPTKAIEAHDESDRTAFKAQLKSLTADDCGRLPTPVHEGFLNVLDAIISQLGHRVLQFVPSFMDIVLSLLEVYEVKERIKTGDNENMEDEPDGKGPVLRAGAVRGLCYRRLTELFERFAEVFEFQAYSNRIWSCLDRALAGLPEAAANSDKAPSLLLLLRTLSSNTKLLPILAQKDLAVESVLKCLSGTSCVSVTNATLTFIGNLLPNDSTHDDRLTKVEVEFDGAALIKKHVGILLRQFRISLGSRNSINNWRRELNLLCRTSVLVLGNENASEEVRVEELESLCSLLFPFLDLGQRISDQDRLTVLGILQSMIPRLSSDVARTYYSSSAPALGPSRGRTGIISKKGRESIASVFCLISQHHYSGAKLVTDVVRRLCAVHSKRIDEYDYDTIISALGALTASSDDKSSWLSMVQTHGCGGSVVLSPIIYSCFNFVYEADGVVARSAVKALKELIALAAQEAGFNDDEKTKATRPTSETDEWKRLLEGTLMPLIRSGLSSRDASYRRFFVQLLSEAVRACRTSGSPNLYGDLACLINAEEQDLDFFMNITHVQIHRRTRALRRLRKHVTSDPDSIGLQSISNILLPIALHPVYESTTKLEEPFALEAIATIGSLARLLSWSKYNNTLWTTLTQFHRHPEQERYIIGVLCSMIDAFHFDVAMSDEEDNADKSSVLRALENRIICKVEDLLVKEKAGKGGTKMRVLRPAVVLALVKLFQKLPRKNFEAKAPRLLTVICDSLKSRESDARDLARSTLAKVAVEISLDFLPDILRELTVTLKEGYQLHVRAAAVHAILLELSGTYKPTIANDDDGHRSQLPFDAAVPSLMDTILADLWGVAQERKDATDNQVRFVKEAGGSKSLHALELVSSMLLFDPKSNAGTTGVSSIHAVVFPLLDRLRADGTTTKTIRRIRDALSRVVQGLSRNPTFSPDAALPFVYATLAPFVSKEEIESTLEIVNDLESDDEDDGLRPIAVSGAAKLDETKETRGKPIKNLPVVEWRPSVIQASTTRTAAMQAKTRTETSDRRVLDGASAPKLTGSSRRKSTAASRRGSLNDDATSSAVVFALQVLHSCLRKGINTHDPTMLDPFVPLLTTCLCQCREADIVLLSLRCLGSLLRTELPSIERFAKALSGKTLDLLVSSGNNQELLQATFKMLMLLINFDRSSVGSSPAGGSRNDENALKGGKTMPLDAEQMQVLISFLQSSIVESDQHNPALALVKAIISRRFVSPEIYDLMKTLLEQSVRSPKPSLREQSNVIFVNFLLNYPMTENRLEQELKQIVLNLGYEHADGRLSAIALVNAVVDRLPEPVLVRRGQLFFLPLTLQLANDESKQCREAVAKCLSTLLSRLPTESLQSFHDYTRRWSESDDRLLRRTSLLLYSIFVDSCDTFMKRGDTIERLIGTIGQLLIDEFGDWEVVYLALVCLEKMAPQALLDQNDNVWKSIVGCMIHRHAWVQAASCRLVSKHLQDLDAISFFDKESTTFLRVPGSLFQLARNFCRVLGRDEADFNDDDELSSLVAKALSWIIRAMNRYPDLCYSDSERAEDDGDRDPVWWLMRRLNNIAKPKGDKRRQAVFKCFAAFATSSMDIASNYLELMIEPIQRAERESLNELERPSLLNNAPVQDSVSDLAKEVLYLIEEQCQSHEKFVHAYAEVKKRARDKKDQRKATETTEAAVDPKAAAQRKIKKKEQEHKRRKRRVEERRQARGAVAKRRHLN